MRSDKRKRVEKAKLSFQKKTFRVLDDKELSEVKGGDGEMVLSSEMVLTGD